MTEDDSGQLKRLLAERETYLQTASLGMLNIVVDVAGSFRNKLKAGQELTMYDQTLDVMGGVLQSRLIGISVKPRQESGLDRTKFLPGQHKGVSIEYFISNRSLNIFSPLQLESLSNLIKTSDDVTPSID